MHTVPFKIPVFLALVVDASIGLQFSVTLINVMNNFDVVIRFKFGFYVISMLSTPYLYDLALFASGAPEGLAHLCNAGGKFRV